MPHSLRIVSASPNKNAPPHKATIGIITDMTGSHRVIMSPFPESRCPYETIAMLLGKAPNNMNSARLLAAGAEAGTNRTSTHTAGNCISVNVTIDQPSGNPNNFCATGQKPKPNAQIIHCTNGYDNKFMANPPLMSNFNKLPRI